MKNVPLKIPRTHSLITGEIYYYILQNTITILQILQTFLQICIM